MIRYLSHRARRHHMRRVYLASPQASFGVHRYYCYSCGRGWGAVL